MENETPEWVKKAEKKPGLLGRLFGKESTTDYQGFLILPEIDTQVFYTSSQRELYKRELSLGRILGRVCEEKERVLKAGIWFDKPLKYAFFKNYVEGYNPERIVPRTSLNTT